MFSTANYPKTGIADLPGVLAPAISVLALMLSAVPTARSQETELDRSIYFIDRSIEATDLLHEGLTEQALEIFQELLTNYPDLDDDGYVASAVADCLAALARDDQARAAYEFVATHHPELAARANGQLVELELVGKITESLIVELRMVSETDGEDRFLATWQLGRALEKHAKALIDEAAAAFRTAMTLVEDGARLGTESFPRQAAMLEELAEDLGEIVNQAERQWSTIRKPFQFRPCDKDAAAPPAVVLEQFQSQSVFRKNNGRQIRLEIRSDTDKQEFEATADGNPITLDCTQKTLIRRHQERINAILLEAAGITADEEQTKQ